MKSHIIHEHGAWGLSTTLCGKTLSNLVRFRRAKKCKKCKRLLKKEWYCEG